MNMRLLGAPTLKDVVPDMVDVGSISQHVVAVPGDRLYDANCKILSTDPCLKISDSVPISFSDESMQIARLREAKSRL